MAAPSRRQLPPDTQLGRANTLSRSCFRRLPACTEHREESGYETDAAVGGESGTHHHSVSVGRRRGVAAIPPPPPRWQFDGQHRDGHTVRGHTHHRAAVRRSTWPRTRNSSPEDGQPGHGDSDRGSARSARSTPRTPRLREPPARRRRSPSGRTKDSRAKRFPTPDRHGDRASEPQWRIPERQPAPDSAAARYASQPPILGGDFHTGATGTFPALGTNRAHRDSNSTATALTPRARAQTTGTDRARQPVGAGRP